MRALVTGGAGFIGSHLVDALIERGDDVLVLDDLSSGKRENLARALERGVKLELANVTDAEPVLAAAERFEPEAVIHLAAQIDIRRSVSDPGFDALVNVVGTVNLLEAARRAGSRRFVLGSTGGAIYGEGAERPEEMPFTEDAPTDPFSAYGQSKLTAEGYVGFYRRVHELAGVSLRLGNVYGPRQDPATEAGVVAIFCELAVGGGRPTVFGDGEQTRDYIYVGEVVAAMLAALETEDAGPFNVGTGRETTVLELAEMIGRTAGREDFEPRFAPPREGEVQRTALDTARAAEGLGWRAEVTLEQGLGPTLEATGS
jgi:UDP-glucose 4-epimerase